MVLELHINLSSDETVDLASIDEAAQRLGFQQMDQEPRIGRSGRVPCVGHVAILKVYRYTDSVGFAAVRFHDGGLLSVAFSDTSEPGKELPEASRKPFVDLAHGLISRFGRERTSVPPMQSGCVNWNGLNLDTSGS